MNKGRVVGAVFRAPTGLGLRLPSTSHGPLRGGPAATGEIEYGVSQSNGDDCSLFKHSQSLEAEDVWRMKVVAGGHARVGIAAEGYDVERDDETYKSTAVVMLFNGTTVIRSDISEDGEHHRHYGLLEDYIPKTHPYDLALRINKDGNMPQLRFNEDGQWHNGHLP